MLQIFKISFELEHNNLMVTPKMLVEYKEARANLVSKVGQGIMGLIGKEPGL